jgi:hypothetical protein
MVVTCVAMDLPADHAEADLWSVFRQSVAKASPRRGRNDARIVIADSKRLHRPKAGIAAIERSALGLLSAADRNPDQLDTLLRALIVDEFEGKFDAYPWYRDLRTQLPRAAGGEAIKLSAGAFRRDLEEVGGGFASIEAHTLLVGELNDRIAKGGNKDTLRFEITTRILDSLMRSRPAMPVLVFADRHGGRIHYRAGLMRAFPQAEMHVAAESGKRSEYRLESDGRSVRVIFSVGADADHMLPAAASIVAKYVRELLIERINDFWTARVDGLKPTAGYYKDGVRFLREVEDARREMDQSLWTISRNR